MRDRRQPDTRTRVLRWLLAVLTVAGMGVVVAGDCVGDTPPPAAVAAAGPTYSTAYGSERHAPSVADGCHLQAAPRPAASTDGTSVGQPPAGFRTLPAGPPPTSCKSRQPGAVTLTDIGISRT